jgi:hypothetical protein
LLLLEPSQKTASEGRRDFLVLSQASPDLDGFSGERFTDLSQRSQSTQQEPQKKSSSSCRLSGYCGSP